MVYAQKGNKVVKINEECIERYANQGFKIVNGNGEVVRDSIPTDIPNLRRAYIEHTKQIAELKAEIDTLTAKLNAVKTAKVEPTVEVVDTDVINSDTEAKKPKTKTTKKSE